MHSNLLVCVCVISSAHLYLMNVLLRMVCALAIVMTAKRGRTQNTLAAHTTYTIIDGRLCNSCL